MGQRRSRRLPRYPSDRRLHPDYANVVWDGAYWAPAEGYEWVSDEADDYRVQPRIGTPNPDVANVYWGSDGWVPGDGYAWASDDPDDLAVVRDEPYFGDPHPDQTNVFWATDGWQPEEGYEWVSDDPEDFSARRIVGWPHPDNPDVAWSGDGWQPVDGFEWVNTDAGDFLVRRIVGWPHAENSNLLWDGDGWMPAEGYTWANDDPDNLSLVAVEAAAPPEQVVAVPPTDSTPLGSLRIAEVPSPAGYTSDSERQTQLALLNDAQIDHELDRIQRIMAVMQEDFESDSKALERLYLETQKAEKDALMDSFQLLIGGSLKKWEAAWKQYPKIKLLAENGLRYLSAEKQITNWLENPEAEDANRELARVYMLELYGVLRSFDEDLISEGGPPAATFASFLVDYSYQVTRWALARSEINMIVDNLGEPNGKLNAQRAIARLQKDLYEKQRRRRAGG